MTILLIILISKILKGAIKKMSDKLIEGEVLSPIIEGLIKELEEGKKDIFDMIDKYIKTKTEIDEELDLSEMVLDFYNANKEQYGGQL